METEDLIMNKIEEIKKHIGVQLVPCEYFSGIQTCDSGKKYFNVILQQRTSESDVFTKLLGLKKYKIVSKIEPNGLKRVAIFF
ncbi:hypothetical protein [Chryseobacterium sp.]|uniref:hypothetical protein n=1 Tax=Chryseobacterium sp. TaxID=1871047 RepID=UPI002897F3DD|nr:hypothetical protein [Chryseobacterium sp.]